jgi:hypothetical protein
VRYFILFLPLWLWAVLPEAEMDKIEKKYYDLNISLVNNYTYNKTQYYIILNTQEQFFKDDTIEEEIPYLKAGIKKLLFEHIKKKNPILSSIEVSNLLFGSFWQSDEYFHSIAQVKVSDVKPLYEPNVTEPNATASQLDGNQTFSKVDNNSSN